MYLDEIAPQKRLRNLPWNVVDFEMTYKVPTPEPIEVGIVPIIGGEIDKDGIYASLIKPKNPLPQWLEAECSISNEMLRDAPSLDDIKSEVRKRIASAVFIHHSTNHCDLAWASHHFAVNRDKVYHFNTLRMSKLLYSSAKNGHSLEAVCKRLQIKNSNPHRALADALATAKAFLKMMNALRDRRIETFGRLSSFYNG